MKQEFESGAFFGDPKIDDLANPLRNPAHNGIDNTSEKQVRGLAMLKSGRQPEAMCVFPAMHWVGIPKGPIGVGPRQRDDIVNEM